MERLADVLNELVKMKGIKPKPQLSHEDFVRLQAEQYNETQGELNKNGEYNCERCNNKGLIAFYLEGNAGFALRKCECVTTRKILRLASESGMGSELKEKTLDNYLVKSEWQGLVKSGVQTYLREGAQRWLYIGGQSGSGKTHLCTAVCGELLKKGFEVVLTSWVEASRELKAVANDVEFSRKMSRYKDAQVLYIDDLFKSRQKEMPSSADLRIAFELISSRAAANKITVISSELHIGELIEIDEAIGSRIKQKCARFILLIGRSKEKNYRLTHS